MPRPVGKSQGAFPEYGISLHLSPSAYVRLKFLGHLDVFIDVIGNKLTTNVRLTDRQLIEAFNKQMSLREIAMITGWSAPTVMNKLRALGVDTSGKPADRAEVAVPTEDKTYA